MFETISNIIKGYTGHQDIKPYIKVRSLQSGDTTVSLDLQQMRKDQVKCNDRRAIQVLFDVSDVLAAADIAAEYRNGYKGADQQFHNWPQIYCRSANKVVTPEAQTKLLVDTVAAVFKQLGIKVPEGVIENAAGANTPPEVKVTETQQDDTPLP